MPRICKRTPAQDGFRMPAEFEPHDATWMLWPERPDNWRLGAKPAQHAFAAVAAAISQSEAVTVGVSARQYANARALLPPTVRLVELSSNDAWMRDVGPTFVIDQRGRVRGVDWMFNAWGGVQGGVYFPWDLDEQVASKVLEIEGLDRYRAPFVLEGGAIHVDGKGTVLATEQCLLNRNRNPGLTRADIETQLQRYLGVEQVIWLGKGITDDETDGHVDNLCCFVKPGEVALTWCENRSDPDYEVCRDAYERLKSARDARGRTLKVHRIPHPEPMFITAVEAAGIDRVEGSRPRKEGDRLAASYVNFYIANRHVLMPQLAPATDRRARTAIGRALPGRKVVGLPAREILLGGGNIHCITQQQPRPRRVTTVKGKAKAKG